VKPNPAIAATQNYGAASLTGAIGSIGSVRTPVAKGSAPTAPTSRLRTEFMKALEQQYGKPLGELNPKTDQDLLKLQGACEGFEAHFVKDLLSQMRKSAFSEKDSPTGDLAKDLLDQKLADQTSQSGAGLGIGRTLFAQMGRQVIGQVRREP